MSLLSRLGVELRWAALLVAATSSGCWDFGDTSDAGTATNNAGTVLSNNCITTFSPCGGDVTGTWAVQSICSVGKPADTVNAKYAATYPDCSSACTAASLTVTGQKTYDSGVLTSGEAYQLFESLSFIDTCFTQAKGTSLTDNTCATLANEFYSATCALSATSCNCQVNETLNNTATSYSLAGNSLTEVGASSSIGATVDYCATGNIMMQQRTLQPGTNYVISYARK